jgi:hypothetical protein
MCDPVSIAIVGTALYSNNQNQIVAKKASQARSAEQARVKEVANQERTQSDMAALKQRRKQNATRRSASSGQMGGMLAGAGNFMSARSFFS